MSIPVHNVAYYRGDTYQIIVNFNRADGSPIDLSTGTLTAWISADPADPLGTKLGDWTISLAGTPSNRATMTILPATMASADITKTYVYDVQFKQSPTQVYTFFKGSITIEPDVTDAPAVVL